MHAIRTPTRDEIKHGSTVMIIKKADQPTGRVTEGKVKKIRTTSPSHPHGIKVMLESGEVGRVQGIVS